MADVGLHDSGEQKGWFQVAATIWFMRFSQPCRVNRARTRLAELMGLDHEDGIAGSHGAQA
ncbi:hypothetical protein BB934_39560 (plasmid) [Microvirga ossetica]|uniref:Uncharacterized protein n=1 Tax=Microvirga ossetica TaxID=1882682 RepID=A0A1B2EWH7_9HYPH|nr:hypothetical protein BB934_39560 [Microvirga ossetica]